MNKLAFLRERLDSIAREATIASNDAGFTEAMQEEFAELADGIRKVIADSMARDLLKEIGAV